MEDVKIGRSGIWWPGQGALWGNNGMTFIIPTDNKEVAKERVRRFEEDDIRWCCGCKVEMLKKDVGGKHFAGTYCKKCWEEYKERNKTKCRLCNSPRYACCC